MDHHAQRRIPLGALYGALGAFVVWALLYLVPMTGALLELVVRPDRVAATVLLVAWPDGDVTYVSRNVAKMTAPAIERGDRIVSIDGVPFAEPAQVARAIADAGPGGRVALVVARGAAPPFTSIVSPRSAAEGDHALAIRLLAAALGVVMPWLCLAVGLWVTLVRPRDPMAWLVLLMLNGIAQIAAVQQAAYLRWPMALRLPAGVWIEFFGASWPIWFTLFGVTFAYRLPWERRLPWVKWIALGPMAVLAAGGIVVRVAETLDARALIPVQRAVAAAGPAVGPVATAAISFFFVVMGWKTGVAESADARRRIRLLFWGATLALSPLCVLLAFGIALGRPVDALPVTAIIGALAFVPIFPATLAYVILVDKAMDVRVAVRQGLRYAVTRGAIRFGVFVFMLAALWNAWVLVNDLDANRPRKLQAIAWAMAAAILLPRLAKRAFEWTDKKFFREAYDAEHVLTNLSDEVRSMVETEPLLDTVLDRIGATLHVDKLVVFLLENDAFVPVRSRGFDPVPAVAFPAGADALRRLGESRRPARIRHDDIASPLRREPISEENRTRLAQVDAEIILPLLGKKELLGAITLGPKKSEEPYSLSDAKLLGLVAAQAGLALENSRLTASIAQEVARRERMSREIEIARDVQQKLFPQKLPRVDGFDCAGFCRPAQGVGGDYYDFLALPGGRLGVALGDVAGKGIPAALLMASLQASLRGQRLSGPSDLAQLVTNLNYLIYEASPDNRYATFFYGEIEPRSRRLTFVNAGHNAPMLFRAADGRLERLPASGPVVGLVDAGRFEQRSVDLDPGDLLVVYSDGISEAMNPDEEEWGEERLAAAVRAASGDGAGALIEKLFVAADAFAAGATQHDDMTVVVVRVAADER